MNKYYSQTHICHKCNCVMTIRSETGMRLNREDCPECGHEMRFVMGKQKKEAGHENQ